MCPVPPASSDSSGSNAGPPSLGPGLAAYPIRRARPTVERIRELFRYDPETGQLTRNGKPVGSRGKRGYVQVSVDGSNYEAHRLIWVYVNGRWPAQDIDHRNGIRHDNRYGNLREATRSQNLQNLHHQQPGASGVLGATRSGNRWKSQIWVDGSRLHLGYYSTATEAGAAYLQAKRTHHEFSPLAA